MKSEIKWNKMEDGDPGEERADEYYLIILHGKFITISYFFIDSFGPSWSSQWDIWDQCFNSSRITHWAECPKLPVI